MEAGTGGRGVHNWILNGILAKLKADPTYISESLKSFRKGNLQIPECQQPSFISTQVNGGSFSAESDQPKVKTLKTEMSVSSQLNCSATSSYNKAHRWLTSLIVSEFPIRVFQPPLLNMKQLSSTRHLRKNIQHEKLRSK